VVIFHTGLALGAWRVPLLDPTGAILVRAEAFGAGLTTALA